MSKGLPLPNKLIFKGVRAQYCLMLNLILETNNFLLVIVVFFLSISAIMVIFSANPVHAVFFLILVVLCLSSIFIGLGVEFLGVVLIVVYVGAIAVLFL